jgi:hypothetical protein
MAKAQDKFSRSYGGGADRGINPGSMQTKMEAKNGPGGNSMNSAPKPNVVIAVGMQKPTPMKSKPGSTKSPPASKGPMMSTASSGIKGVRGGTISPPGEQFGAMMTTGDKGNKAPMAGKVNPPMGGAGR